MKRFFIISFFCFFIFIIPDKLIAQVVYNMEHDIPITRCGFTYRDPGGASNYDVNLDYQQTLSSDNGDRLIMFFNSFSLGAGDFLYIYDGNGINLNQLLAVFSANNPGTSILSTSNYLTLRFVSNASGVSSGWEANVQCVSCVPRSTVSGSPCSSPTPATPFCTGANPYASIVYPASSVDPPGQSSAGAVAFLGTSSTGCLYSFPNPAWYYIKVSQSGNLNFYIEQTGANGAGLDVDFACWGPFDAPNQHDFVDLLCCGFYTLSSSQSGGNMIDCSYSTAAIENCTMNGVIAGKWYILLLTNYSGQPATISFNLQSSSTATTDCSITSPFAATPVCEGQDITITIQSPTPGSEYDITGPNGYHYRGLSTSIIIPNATLANSGTYTLVVYNGAEQGSPASNEILVYPKPRIDIVNEPVCIGEEATFVASDTVPDGENTTFVWVVSPGVTQSSSTFHVTADTDTNYYSVYATSMYGCEASVDSIHVLLYPSPVPYIQPDSVCPNTPLNAYPNETGYSFHWNTGETTSYISREVNAITNYTVTVTDPNGCTGTITGTVLANPVADFIPDNNHVYIENGQGVITFYDNATDANSWYWNFGDNSSIDNYSTLESPTHGYTKPGTYFIMQTVTSHHNCIDSVKKMVLVEAPYFFYAPNSFTPNGDGINDYFSIKGEGIDPNNFEMIIYNRFGEMVFVTRIPGDTWDGRAKNGAHCPMGEYVYVIKTLTLNGDLKEYIGAFALIR